MGLRHIVLAIAAAAGVAIPAGATAAPGRVEIDVTEQACDRSVPWPSTEAYIRCLGSSESILVGSYRPDFADTYESFQQARLSLARAYDAGQIDWATYLKRSQTLQAEFLAAFATAPRASSSSQLMDTLADLDTADWTAPAAQSPAP